MRVISAVEAKRLVDEENALLVDIREPGEYAREYVQGARLAPLSVLSLLPPDPDRERTAVFFCRSGTRAGNNAAMLEHRGFAASFLMEGGLESWKTAGLPVTRRRLPMPMPRQIQLGAGFLVFFFTLLGFVFPIFAWAALFVGAGLMFAGYTGVCLLASLLARMPWNRER